MERYGFFQSEERIGEEPAGPVFLARHVDTGILARVYTLRADKDPESGAAENFRRRRQAAILLSRHPRFTSLLDSGVEDGAVYYALQEPSGETLAQHGCEVESAASTLIRPAGMAAPRSVGMRAPSAWMARGWMLDLASVVDHAHRQGVILGNLSPAGVWIGRDGALTLADPGNPYSSREDRASNQAPAANRAPFLAPEQWLGRCSGAWCDIYALGAILWWLLGGTLPPARYEEAARLGRFLPLPPPPDDADEALSAICVRAVQTKPRERFPTAALFRAALQVTDPVAAASPERHSSRGTLIRGLLPFSAGVAASNRWSRWFQHRER